MSTRWKCLVLLVPTWCLGSRLHAQQENILRPSLTQIMRSANQIPVQIDPRSERPRIAGGKWAYEAIL